MGKKDKEWGGTVNQDKLEEVQEGFIQFGEGSWRRKKKNKNK